MNLIFIKRSSHTYRQTPLFAGKHEANPAFEVWLYELE